MSDRLFNVTLQEVVNGKLTDRRMMTMLSEAQLKSRTNDIELVRLFELVNGAELEPDAVQ
jgi:hypothetical protein